MRAFEWNGSRARIVDRGVPRPGPGFALVRVALAGVCRTDLEIVRGYMGFRGILGHEFVGKVTDGPREWIGRRVVSEINFSCGACPACDKGLGRHCPARKVMGIDGADGAFAEYVKIPAGNLHEVPRSVPDEAAVFAEPLAAAFEILEQIHVTRGETAVVLGDGRLGLLVAQVLDRVGASVLLVGRHERKLALARRWGLEALDLARWEPVQADLVVEATGKPGGLELAMRVVRSRGRLVLKSTFAEPASLDLSPLVIKEVIVVGSRCGPFAPALSLLENGEVDVLSLVEQRVPLTDAATALELAARPGVLKVLVDCSA